MGALSKLIQCSSHDPALTTYILLSKTKWTRTTFDSINWDAHERAFNWKIRKQQCSLAKLVHGLANTNIQNHLFHGTSPYNPYAIRRRKHFPMYSAVEALEPQLSRTNFYAILINLYKTWLHHHPSHEPSKVSRCGFTHLHLTELGAHTQQDPSIQETYY